MAKENTMLKLCLSVVVALFLSGCANGHRYGAPEKVIVDTLGVDPYEYQVDLADCEEYAAQINVTERTVEGAVEGAVVGGVLGAVLGNHETAERSAGAGAVLGGVKSNKRSRREQDRIVRRCLIGRGYRVLN
ncbi:glycine zipper family protein [SAR92 clade bacterium H246]|jgi:outer membrane lipoprotein SlyB